MSPLRPNPGWRGLVSAAAILSAAALGVAACGDSGDNAGAVTNSQSNSQTTQGNGQSSNQSNSSSQSGSGSLSQSSFSTDEGDVLTYAGTSKATITVDVEGDSRLLWSNDKGSPFSLSGTGGAAVDSSDGSGEVPLSGGKHRLEVRGKVWTIVIRPG
ncbi:MAG TPA: hypothetical protein VJT75_18180 [Thermoleophilaceae bacterium]|nr:hypothetical protein [Thermoleophilaceae bacterium]